MSMSARRRVAIVCALLAFLTGGLIWLLVFDLWLGQVERQYLWEQARHELGLGRAPVLEWMMAEAAREGAWIAAAWSLLVVAAILGAGLYGYREGRRGSED
jgi:hypothetical protein